jgi:hypothetical protein
MAVKKERKCRLSFDDAEHLADGFLETYEQGAGDDGEPDGYFVYVGDCVLEECVILIVEPMAGVHLQAEGVCVGRRPGESFRFGLAYSGRAGVGEVAGMEFDARGASLDASVDLFQDGINKKRDLFDAGIEEAAGDDL